MKNEKVFNINSDNLTNSEDLEVEGGEPRLIGFVYVENEYVEELEKKAKALDEIVKSLNESYVDTYNPVTKTTSYNVLNHHNLANEVEEIILSNGLKNESEDK